MDMPVMEGLSMQLRFIIIRRNPYAHTRKSSIALLQKEETIIHGSMIQKKHRDRTGMRECMAKKS